MKALKALSMIVTAAGIFLLCQYKVFGITFPGMVAGMLAVIVLGLLGGSASTKPQNKEKEEEQQKEE